MEVKGWLYGWQLASVIFPLKRYYCWVAEFTFPFTTAFSGGSNSCIQGISVLTRNGKAPAEEIRESAFSMKTVKYKKKISSLRLPLLPYIHFFICTLPCVVLVDPLGTLFPAFYHVEPYTIAKL